jgi:hypothetical protein
MRFKALAARRVALAVALVCCASTCATEKSAGETPLKEAMVFIQEEGPRDEFGISNGTADVANRYRSVVSIRNGKSSCSGVLAAPRLVLTAAHCFCQPSSETGTMMDGSNCAREVAVLSYSYRRVRGGWKPAKDITLGQVIIHESFRSEIERSGGRAVIKSKVAELAAIRLERELENTVVEDRLASEEVSLKEELTLVGYGATAPDGDDTGTRRFGRNIVTELRLADDGKGHEIRFRFPGSHTHSGDSGGPCFREQGDARWLVGINGGYVSQGRTESWFTSTSSHQEWIQKQIAEARKVEAP